MLASSKRVSIIIPVYNGSNFLRDAIDSALAQTYKNTEVIVVDDGSNDDGATEKIAKSYGSKVKYYKKENGGVATALNLGIKKMTGEYFSWLSHDDMYDKNKIKEQIKFLELYGDSKTIVACGAKVLFDSGVAKNEKIDKELFNYFDIFLAIAGDVGVNGCSLLIPKRALIESSGFDKDLPVTQDYDLWFRLNKSYEFILLEKNLVISRRHDKQDSVQKQNICFEAGDKLHYDFIKEIGYERFEEYISKSGIGKTWDKYVIYKNAGFVKTASMILKIVLEYYSRHDKRKYEELINTEIGKFVNQNALVSKKKRILLYCNVWRMGGVERVLSYIFNNFKNQNEFFLVINDDPSDDGSGYAIPNDVHLIKINNQSLIAELMNVIALFDIDIFIGNPNFVDDFLDIYKNIRGTGTKSIAYNHIHFLLPYTIERLYPVAVKQNSAFANADKVIWISEVACNVYNLDHDNGVFIPNPVSITKGIKPRVSPNKRILAVGRFGEDEVKRPDRLIKVFSEIIKIDPSYSLDIVGYCNMDVPIIQHGYIRLGDYIKNLGIPANRIFLHGHQEDVNKFYDGSDVLVLTSTYEGFALVLAEAMSRGVPCACFDYVGLDELVQDGSNGIVAEQDDYIGLARKIVDLVSNDRRYADYSKNAIDSVCKFDENLFANRWKLLIDSFIENNDDIKLLVPENTINEQGKKIINEYKNIVESVIGNYSYTNKQLEICQQTPQQCNKAMDSGIIRLTNCLKSRGVVFTIKTIIFKSYNKLRNVVRL